MIRRYQSSRVPICELGLNNNLVLSQVLTSVHWLTLLQILVSCFVKTSHFEEYLCVKVRLLLNASCNYYDLVQSSVRIY